MASLLVSVTSKGVVTCMRKVGKGSLDPESVFEMMEVGSGSEAGAGLAGRACCSLPPRSHQWDPLHTLTQTWSLEDSWCELGVC